MDPVTSTAKQFPLMEKETLQLLQLVLVHEVIKESLLEHKFCDTHITTICHSLQESGILFSLFQVKYATKTSLCNKITYEKFTEKIMLR